MPGISKGSRKTPSFFTVGETYAGVKVLEVTVEGCTTQERRYLGEFLCCGDIQEIHHPTLRQRVLNKRKTWPVLREDREREKDDRVADPTSAETRETAGRDRP